MIKKNSPDKLGSLQKLYLAVLRLRFLSHLTVLNYFTVKFNHDFTIYNERFPKKPSGLQASQVSVVRSLLSYLFLTDLSKTISYLLLLLEILSSKNWLPVLPYIWYQIKQLSVFQSQSAYFHPFTVHWVHTFSDIL